MDHVALLSALPRTYEEIVAGATDRSKDYIRTQVLRNLNTPESAWETLGPHLDASENLWPCGRQRDSIALRGLRGRRA